MNVGVHVRYQSLDLTYAALQVADLAVCCGNGVSVYTTTPRRRPVHARWDGRVVRGVKFTDWAETLDLIIWVGCPLIEQVQWTLRGRKGLLRRRAVLVATWDDTGEMIRTVYPAFSDVVAPSHAAAEVLGAATMKNVRTIPWSPRLPITVRPPLDEGQRPSLHFPLHDARREHDAATVDMIERILRHGVAADVHVSLNGRSGEVVRRLERRAREHTNLTLARCTDFELFLLALGAHDLTVLVGVGDAFGMTALCSLHAGTPVVAFDAPPLDELVISGKHGVLVPGAVTHAPPGGAVPGIRDYAQFEVTLARVLEQHKHLAALRANCSVGLAVRAARFEQMWGSILHEA
jgi:hypothetical protein